MVIILIKINVVYFSAVNIYIRNIKKVISTLPVLCTLIMPFEQMVYAAHFSLSIQKTNDVNIEDQYHLTQGKPSKKTVIKTHKNNSSSHHSPKSPEPFTPSVIQSDTMDGNRGGLVSNANNFHGIWNASVDPRTGNASFSLMAGSILYDGGQAKRDLTLTYSGGPAAQGADTFGPGPHWGFNVGAEHVSAAEVAGHKTTDIVTGDGHRITMIKDRNTEGNSLWRPLHHRLNDITFTGAPGDWTLSKATDVRERIVDGYALREQARDGRKLYFYYDRSGAGQSVRRLTYICGHQLTMREQQGAGNACVDDGVWITYRGSSITLHGHQNIILHRGENGGIGNIRAITMPSLSSDGIGAAMCHTLIRQTY